MLREPCSEQYKQELIRSNRIERSLQRCKNRRHNIKKDSGSQVDRGSSLGYSIIVLWSILTLFCYFM